MPKKLISLDELSRFKSNLDTELETKANVDGNYPTMTTGLADNLTPYGEDSGAEQEKPFISNGTGTNNNTEIVTVGDYGLLKEKQGSVYCVNQGFKELTSETTNATNGSIAISNNVLTFTASSSYWQLVGSFRKSTIAGHYYYIKLKYQSSKNFNLQLSNVTNISLTGDGTWKTYVGVVRVATNSTSQMITDIWGTGFTNGDEILFDTKPEFVDLTQWFNGDIPQDLLDHPEHWSWYCNKGDYIPYNTGTLENANGVKLVSTKRNLWDEEWVNEQKDIDTTTGQVVYSPNYWYFRSVNYITVIPNTTYHSFFGNGAGNYRLFFYDKDKNYINYISTPATGTFVTPSNAFYMLFRYNVTSSGGSSWTYNYNFTISLYYTPEQGGEGYDKYYPYEQPYVVDTGSELLRKAGSVCDYKEPNGLITRRVGSVDLSTLSWNTTNDLWYAIISDMKKGVHLTKPNILSNKWTTYPSKYSDELSSVDKICTIWTTTNRLIIKDTSITQASQITGTLYYELATPTTEQGTPFAENLPINDYGMLYWLDDNDELVGIPQGAKIFYPTNYKGFVDDMYSRVDGDSSKYVIQSELQASETQRDTIDAQLKEALGGTLRQVLSAKASLDFNNTAWVDLGTLSDWSYDSGAKRFGASVTGMKPVASSTTLPNIITTLYQTLTNSDFDSNTNVDLTIRSHTSVGYIFVRNLSYTDATAFKNAMKGVLLAYEKA